MQCSINRIIVTMTSWMPDIVQSRGPKYLAIADAIALAVSDGHLPPGSKLPPQRNLAYDIGVTLGTITRAYSEAERRGLVGGEVGRGTFVLGARQIKADGFVIPEAPAAHGVIDFTHAAPATGRAGRALSKTLIEIASEPNIDVLANYQMNTGLQPHLEAGSQWLTRQGLRNPDIERITLTNGSNHGILVAMMTLANPGETILVEPLTYPGILHQARILGYRVEAVETDEDGFIPEALEEACRRYSPRLLYCMPNVQNPTTISMSEDRRRAVADIVESSGMFIIEDDIWGGMVESNAPHMADLLPDRTVYLAALSKCMAGGLRIGYALAPARLSERLRASVRMTCWMPAPLMAEIARRWITDGTGDELRHWQRAEVTKRIEIGLSQLAESSPRYQPGGHHIWLDLPEPWRATDFKAMAESRGVRVLSGDSFAIDNRASRQGVRICVGKPESLDQVEQGMRVLADVLHAGPGMDSAVF